MGYRWRKLKFQQEYVNREHNIKSREIFAKQIIYAIEQGKEILSLDESAFTNNKNGIKGWVKK